MVSLLARLPRRSGRRRRPAAAADLARRWPRAGRGHRRRAGRASGWRSSSSRPWTRPADWPVGASLALAGRLLAARPGRRAGRRRPGPLVLAPLLLTLGIAWGLSRAGRVRGPRCTTSTAGPDAARGDRRWSSACTSLLTLLLALPSTRPARGVGLVRTVAGAVVLAVVAVGWGRGPRVRRCSTPSLDRLPGAAAAAAARRAGRPADRAGAVHRRRRRRAGLRRARLRGPLRLPRRCGGRRAGPARPRACCCCPTPPPPSSGWPPARASSSAPARWCRCTGSRSAPCPRCRCWPPCPTPRPCR